MEVGLGFEHSTDVDLVDHYDPLEFYSVGDDGIRFSVIRESNLETFETNDSVLRSQSLRGLPAVLTRAEHTTIGTDLNGRLRPTAGVPLSEAVVTPAIRVEAEGRSVKLTARGDVVTVPADATRTLELGPVSSETRNGAAVDATAEVSVRNHGTLDVYADRIVGGQ